MIPIPKRLIYGVILLFACFGVSYEIACKDERDRDVDWYVNYKIPKIEKEPRGSNLYEGKAYAYIKAPGTVSWKLSDKSITSESMLENTLKSFYLNKQSLSYLFYNDDAPSNSSGSTVGHLKGVLAFDGISGYWLVHSIPKFAREDSFEYPNNALVNGQSVLCVTFSIRELNEICQQLLYSHPNIYARGLTDAVREKLDDKAKTLFTQNPAFVRREPLTRRTDLKSLANQPFVSFAKDNQYKNDLYSNIIAPGLQTSLLAETWRRGSGTVLPPACESNYSVRDIVSISMTVMSGLIPKTIQFKSTEDHSKWAIADDVVAAWVCVADLNRMLSQENRGGGALCFNSTSVRSAYRSLISETDQCPLIGKK